MRVSFSWFPKGKSSVRASSVVDELNSKGNLKGWRAYNERSGEQTLEVEVKSLHRLGLATCKFWIEKKVRKRVEIRIGNRLLMPYAVWADDQIRRLNKKIKLLEESSGKVRKD